MDIKHDETSVTVEGATDDDDEKFVEAMDFGDGRTMLTRTHDADADGNTMVEVAIVSTDIEAPKAVPFAMWESNLAGDTPQALNLSTDTTNDTPTTTNEALGIVAGNIGMVKSSEFTAPAGTVGTTVLSFQQAVEDDASTTDVDESRDAAEIMGTFNDSPGVYRCVATGDAACTATVNTMGVVSAVSNDNDWAFFPAADATTDQPDYDYLHYGFWLKRTTNSDGEVTYNEVETFADSSVPQSTGLGTVTGRATYSGGAVGVYVRETYKETDGSIDSATSGHFTADANLVAHFGQTVDDPDTTPNEVGQIPPRLLNTLTGTIDNFVLQHGEVNEWSVNLQETPDPATGNIDGGGTASGMAQGGGDAGTWNATFHGPTTDDTQPHSVVGEFNANFGNGFVAGGFGARKD